MTTDACGMCGAAVVWAVHAKTRRPMILNAAPVAAGAWAIDAEGLARHSPGDDLLGEPRYVIHFATCPDAPPWARFTA